MMKRPDMRSYFRGRIDWHVNGMLSRMNYPRPSNVKSVQGDVTDYVITVTMLDGTKWYWQGGEYGTRKVNLCYPPKMPKPIDPPPPMKYADGHTEHTEDCMSSWSEARRHTHTDETIQMNHRLHMYDVEHGAHLPGGK